MNSEQMIRELSYHYRDRDLRNLVGNYRSFLKLRPQVHISCPDRVPVLLKKRGALQFRNIPWGLIPASAMSPDVRFNHVNIAADSLTDHPALFQPFQKQRCAAVVSGFYVWQVQPGGHPYYIQLRLELPMLIAGIYDHWRHPNGLYHSTFSILTVPGNEDMEDLNPGQQKMPAILYTKEQRETWLDNSFFNKKGLIEVLRPAPPYCLSIGRAREFDKAQQPSLELL